MRFRPASMFVLAFLFVVALATGNVAVIFASLVALALLVATPEED